MFPVQLSRRMCSGPRGVCPYNSAYGAKPVVSLLLSLMAHNMKGTHLCHWREWLLMAWWSIRLNVWLKRSTVPDASGCDGLLNHGVQPMRSKNAFVSCLVKLVPQSDEMMEVTLKCEKVSHKHSQTDLAARFRNKYENGHRVCKQITFKMYL